MWMNKNRVEGKQLNNSKSTRSIAPVSYQHVNVVDEIQEEHSQLHGEVCVVDVGALALPGAWMLQVPQMNGVSEWKNFGYKSQLLFRQHSE